jgi:D-galactose 1-dehydrogenase
MSMTRLALVGIGKIARDAHIPTLAASSQFDLAAAVTSRTPPEGVPGFRTIREMAKAMPDVTAVSICTPPHGRLALVAEAFDHGLDVMIEKPPAGTISEAECFARMARRAGRILYVTWHSREAAAVEPARKWLSGKAIHRVAVNWKEDVRVWHPGQEWIWEPGIGVFDPGINALSVLTAILPRPLRLDSAELRFPANRDAPIAASLAFSLGATAPVTVEFDFDQKGPQSWDIDIDTDGGRLSLSMGASRMAVDGKPVDVGDEPEYRRLYRRFAELLVTRQSDIDLTPFHHVADAFLIGRRKVVAPFEWNS